MAEDLRNAALLAALSNVIADLAELVQREMRLARAEISAKLSLKIRAGAWAAAAGAFGFLAVLLALQGLVLGLSAGTGLPLHWSCVIVAGGLLLVAALAFAQAQANARGDMTPRRTMAHLRQDIATAKEQLS